MVSKILTFCHTVVNSKCWKCTWIAVNSSGVIRFVVFEISVTFTYQRVLHLYKYFLFDHTSVKPLKMCRFNKLLKGSQVIWIFLNTQKRTQTMSLYMKYTRVFQAQTCFLRDLNSFSLKRFVIDIRIKITKFCQNLSKHFV